MRMSDQAKMNAVVAVTVGVSILGILVSTGVGYKVGGWAGIAVGGLGILVVTPLLSTLSGSAMIAVTDVDIQQAYRESPMSMTQRENAYALQAAMARTRRRRSDET